MELKYDTFTVDTDSLPESAITALLHRGLTHYLGNEQSSKVTGWKKANPNATDAEIEAKGKEYRDAAYDALLNGTIGTRAGGPKLKGLDRLIHLVGVEHVTNFAREKGAKMPTGKDSAQKIADMVKRWMASTPARHDAVMAEAQRRFEAQQNVVDGSEDDMDVIFGEAAE